MHGTEFLNYTSEVYLQILNMFILTEHGSSLTYPQLFTEYLAHPRRVSTLDIQTALIQTDKTLIYPLGFVY